MVFENKRQETTLDRYLTMLKADLINYYTRLHATVTPLFGVGSIALLAISSQEQPHCRPVLFNNATSRMLGLLRR